MLDFLVIISLLIVAMPGADARGNKAVRLSRRTSPNDFSSLGDFSTGSVSFEVDNPAADSPAAGQVPQSLASSQSVASYSSSSFASGGGRKNLKLHYEYHGPDNVRFQVDILDSDCKQVVDRGPVKTSSVARNFDSGGIDLSLELDINAAQETESEPMPFWFPDTADPTKAEVKFCVALSILEATSGEHVFTAETEAIVLVESAAGYFVAVSGPSGSRGDKLIADPSSTSLAISFPVKVYACDESANMVHKPKPVAMGQPVRFCVSMKFPSDTAHVSNIDMIQYRNAAANLPVTSVVQGGRFRPSLVNIDCALVDGVCLVEFIVLAKYYMKNSALFISGAASISLGLDQDTQEPPGRSRLRALSRQNRVLDDNTTDIQEESQAAFTYQVELIQSGNYSVIEQGALSSSSVTSAAFASTADGVSAMLLIIQLVLVVFWAGGGYSIG